MSNISDDLHNLIGSVLDLFFRHLKKPTGVTLSKNSEHAMLLMEDKGFIDYYVMLQLGSENPEAYMVAADILHMKSSEVLKYLVDNKVPADTFVPKLRQGLKDFYKYLN